MTACGTQLHKSKEYPNERAIVLTFLSIRTFFTPSPWSVIYRLQSPIPAPSYLWDIKEPDHPYRIPSL